MQLIYLNCKAFKCSVTTNDTIEALLKFDVNLSGAVLNWNINVRSYITFANNQLIANTGLIMII